MKRIFLAAAIIIGLNVVAGAQTTGSNSSNSTSVSSADDIKRTKGKKSKSKGTKITPSDTLNNRKMYNWKDGQRATPTGHEATGTNGGYAALGRDSASTRRDSTKQQ